jgi:hypothetical protein
MPPRQTARAMITSKPSRATSPRPNAVRAAPAKWLATGSDEQHENGDCGRDAEDCADRREEDHAKDEEEGSEGAASDSDEHRTQCDPARSVVGFRERARSSFRLFGSSLPLTPV